MLKCSRLISSYANLAVRPSSSYPHLKAVMKKRVAEERREILSFWKEYGESIIDDMTIEKMYGGMHGLKSLISETSQIDAEHGIKFRNRSVLELRQFLPKTFSSQPIPEGMLWLLMTKDLPNNEQANDISMKFARLAHLPAETAKLIRALPPTLPPISQIVVAIASLNKHSLFADAYISGEARANLWQYTLKDSINLLSKLPLMAGMIYRKMQFEDRNDIEDKFSNDYSETLATCMGINNPEFVEFLRLYLTLMCDHTSSDVATHATRLVGSALSDPYLALSAGFSGLAGPLHEDTGLEVASFLDRIVHEIGISPAQDALESFIEDTLSEHMQIPGYGKSTVHQADPRYLAIREFSDKHKLEDKDDRIRLANRLYCTVPPILEEYGSKQSIRYNPWPSAEAHIGVMFEYYGVKERSFWPRPVGHFSCFRCSEPATWDRALQLPLERPKSMTTRALMKSLDVVLVA